MLAARSRTVVDARTALLLGIPGICALLFEPIRWLVRTWWDPAWASDGIWAAVAVAALLVASVRSGPAQGDALADRRTALALVLVTACVRLVGRVLDVHFLGALALAVDVAALATALGVARRPLALSPAALGALFAAALPIEGVLQRVLGHPLRLLGAVVAHALVHPFIAGVRREGALLVDDKLTVHIDLPCSGAQGLVLVGGLVVLLACVLSLSSRMLASAAVAALFGAILSNGARIAALFVGAHAGVDVWSEPWHSLIGLVALALGVAPVLVVVRGAARRRPLARADGHALRDRHVPPLAALAFSVAAFLIARAPGHPVDVAAAPAATGVRLPHEIAGFQSTNVALSALETDYFATWGGFAEKRRYQDDAGALDVIFVRTSSPLRHLHDPARCLSGAGHAVTRLGVIEKNGVPSVLYTSTAPDGTVYDVEASFIRDDGLTATSDAEATWRWLASPSHAWMLVERIRPHAPCGARCARLDAALLAAVAPMSPGGRS